MSPAEILLTFRIAIAIALYVFLGAVFIFMWRDIRLASRQAHSTRRHSARLVVLESAGSELEQGRQYRLQPVTTVGRSPTSTIILPDSYASSKHARLSLRQGQWWLEDMESQNGTQLNGMPVTEPVVLSFGDEIGIGRVKLRFESG